MRFCLPILIILLLFFVQPLNAQTSAADSIPTQTRKLVEQTVRAWQDSVNRERLLRNIREHGKSLDDFLAERKEQERKEERRRWIRIGAVVILLFGLFVAIARRKKARSN